MTMNRRTFLGTGIGLAASRGNVLIQQIFEDRAIFFVPGSIDVRQIVRNYRHARLLSLQSGLGYPK